MSEPLDPPDSLDPPDPGAFRTPNDLLDPRDSRPKRAAALADWLSLQARFVYEPEAAASALRAGAPPREILARARRRGLSERELRQSLRALARLGALALPLTSTHYPAGLRRLADAAPLLLVRGDSSVLGAPAVAVVGARAPTAYGRGVAQTLAGALARAGFVVVSGLARGIDAAAHRAALEAGGRSVAVLGSGLDRMYPPEHRELAEELVSSGALVSEFPLGAAPRAPHFPLRNRLISALCRAVIVVEARERSGSLVTARLALEQGVEVLAVPGPITAPTSRGTNRLLFDGAAPVLGVEDLLRGLGRELPLRLEGEATARALPRDASLLRGHLEARPRSRDELAQCLGWQPGRLAAALLELELDGQLVEERDGCLAAVSPLRGS